MKDSRGKQLMGFIDKEEIHLGETGVQDWDDDAEAKLNEWLEAHNPVFQPHEDLAKFLPKPKAQWRCGISDRPRKVRKMSDRDRDRDLTLEEALNEFPEECKTVLLGAEWNIEKLAEPLSATELYIALRYTGDKLLVDAVRWLAGKPISDATMKKFVAGKRSTHWYEWPEDMLRVLLEEVREQRKQEKEG